MKWIALVLLVSGCASTAPTPDAGPTEAFLVTGFPHLPADARVVVERLAACTHFAGESTGGESPERDAEVRAALARLGCATVETDAEDIRSRHKDDRAVQAALAQAAGL